MAVLFFFPMLGNLLTVCFRLFALICCNLRYFYGSFCFGGFGFGFCFFFVSLVFSCFVVVVICCYFFSRYVYFR